MRIKIIRRCIAVRTRKTSLLVIGFPHERGIFIGLMGRGMLIECGARYTRSLFQDDCFSTVFGITIYRASALWPNSWAMTLNGMIGGPIFDGLRYIHQPKTSDPLDGIVFEEPFPKVESIELDTSELTLGNLKLSSME